MAEESQQLQDAVNNVSKMTEDEMHDLIEQNKDKVDQDKLNEIVASIKSNMPQQAQLDENGLPILSEDQKENFIQALGMDIAKDALMDLARLFNKDDTYDEDIEDLSKIRYITGKDIIFYNGRTKRKEIVCIGLQKVYDYETDEEIQAKKDKKMKEKEEIQALKNQIKKKNLTIVKEEESDEEKPEEENIVYEGLVIEEEPEEETKPVKKISKQQKIKQKRQRQKEKKRELKSQAAKPQVVKEEEEEEEEEKYNFGEALQSVKNAIGNNKQQIDELMTQVEQLIYVGQKVYFDLVRTFKARSILELIIGEFEDEKLEDYLKLTVDPKTSLMQVANARGRYGVVFIYKGPYNEKISNKAKVEENKVKAKTNKEIKQEKQKAIKDAKKIKNEEKSLTNSKKLKASFEAKKQEINNAISE